MTFVSKNFSNGGPTTLSASIDNLATTTTLPVNAPTDTWPAPTYTITLDRGYSYQEVCLVQGATPTGGHPTSLTVIRNYDGNGIYPHNANAVVEISATAQDWKNFNLHNMDSTRDDHPSLMKANGTRHDLTGRHYMGTSLPTGPPSASDFGDVYDPGSAPYLARADHVHGRTDTWGTYSEAMLQPGLIFPITASASNPRLLLCNGGWYNQYQYPELYAAIGNNFAPVGGIANPGTGAGAYNPAIHFAVPTMGQYVNGVMTWNYLATRWAIMADAVT